MINYLIGIGLSLLLSALIGFERESQDKSAGLRTTMLICLGATLTVIFTLELVKIAQPLGISFDMIRAIAYYLCALGFVGGGIIYKCGKELRGITTAALLLPPVFSTYSRRSTAIVLRRLSRGFSNLTGIGSGDSLLFT